MARHKVSVLTAGKGNDDPISDTAGRNMGKDQTGGAAALRGLKMENPPSASATGT